MKLNSRLLIFTLALIAVATLCKYYFGPELAFSGFSPVIAIALFSGMLIKDKSKSFLLPLLAVFASDMIIELLYMADLFPYSGFYSWQIFNYALLLSTTLLGWALKGRNYGSIAAGGVLAPTLFFLFSNFGAWMIDYTNLYADNFSGLMASYEAGLPFYRNALGATLLFLPAIMLGYNALIRNTRSLKLA